MLLISNFLILIFCIIFLFFVSEKNIYIKTIVLFVSSLTLIISCFLLIKFNGNSSGFQYFLILTIIDSSVTLTLSFGLDGISIWFYVLSNILTFLCILFVWEEKKLLKDYFISLLLVNLFLLLVFSVLDLFVFYIFFETLLIPMFLIIGVWGSRERKIRAVYLFFFYTLFGSLLMLLSLMYIYIVVGTFNLEYLLSYDFCMIAECWLWLGFFMSFASKIPIFPLHIWLPEAHVEAPAVGSVLLAGILLKLGVYGFLRFSLTLFPKASVFFSPCICVLCMLGIVYSSLTALRQTDMKRIIAYSSVGHMNLILIGIFTWSIFGLEGSILQSISHGFVSGALFFLIGILYDRYHSRFLYYYSGLVHTMPIYSGFFLIFTLANIALPGTSNFVGEFLLFLGIYEMSIFVCFISLLSVILSGAYSLWLYNKLTFGNIKIGYTFLFKDLNFKEFSILFPLLCFVIFMGIYPSFFCEYLHFFSLSILILGLY